MSWRTIILLGLAALLLSLLLLFGGHQERDAGAGGRRLFAGLEGGAVSQIKLSRSDQDGQVYLKRGDQGWRMLLPVQDRGDRAQVESLLAGVEFMRPLRWLPAASPPAGSGLDKPAIKLSLTSGGGDYKLEVGAADASGQGVYVRLEQGGRSRLAVAPSRLIPLLDLAPAALRDHSLVPLSPAQIRRVDLRGQQGNITLTRQDGAGVPWLALVKGRLCRADGQRLRRLLNALSALRARVIREAPGAKTRPWIQLSGAGGETVTLKQAGPCPGRNDQVLVLVLEQLGTSTRRTVGACLDQQEAALLSPAPRDLQDLSLTPLSEPELDEVTLWTSGQQVHLIRTPSGWTRNGDPVDGLLVRALVDRLRETEARLAPEKRQGDPAARVRLKIELGGAEDLALFSEPGGLLRVRRAGDNAELLLEPEAARSVWEAFQLIAR